MSNVVVCLLSVAASVSLAMLSIYESQKAIERKARNQERDFWKNIQVGQKKKGTVRRIAPYGVFVNLCGGIDGFVHVSDLCWEKINHPDEVVRIGDKISASVKAIDVENKKISLCRKSAEDDPWVVGTKHLRIGDVVKCTVTRILTYGAYAEVAPSVVGLIRTSEISTNDISLPTEVLRIGDEVEARVLGVHNDIRQLELSVAAV